jgi:hypothetical protein
MKKLLISLLIAAFVQFLNIAALAADGDPVIEGKTASGDIETTGNVAGATYGSDSSISDAELLTLDDGATTEILVGGGAGSAPVWTTATGSGAPVRAVGPTISGVLTVEPDGTNETFQVNDGTLDYTDGNAGTTGTLTVDASGNWSYNKNITQDDGKYIATDQVRARDGDGLKLYDDGGSGIFVKDGGNVGIGTSSPDTKLELSSDGYTVIHNNTYSSAEDTVDPQFQFDRGRGTAASPAIVVDNDSMGRLKWAGYDGSNWATGAQIVAYVNGTPGSDDMPTELRFGTSADGSQSPTDRMTIDSSGNVGIADTDPDAALEVVDDFYVSSAPDNDGDLFKVTSTGDATAAGSVTGADLYTSDYVNHTGDNSYFGFSDNDEFSLVMSTVERLCCRSGSIGIGTATPSGLFEWGRSSGESYVYMSNYNDTEATTNNFVLRKADNTEESPALVDDNAVLGVIKFQGYDGSGWHNGAKIEARIEGTPSDGTDMPTELAFSTTPDGSGSPVERMTIKNDGKVGIGTTSPEAALDINHATGDVLQFTYNDSNGSPTDYATFALAADGALTLTTVDADASEGDIKLDPDGLTNVGPSASPGIRLYVEGTLNSSNITSNGAYMIYVSNDGENDNNYAMMGFGGDTMAVGVGAQITDEGNGYGDFVVATRSSVTYAERLRIDEDGIAYMPYVAVHDLAGDDNETTMYIDPDDGEMGYNSSIRASKTNIMNLSNSSWIYDLQPREFNRKVKESSAYWHQDVVEIEVTKEEALENGELKDDYKCVLGEKPQYFRLEKGERYFVPAVYSDLEYHEKTEIGLIAEEAQEVNPQITFTVDGHLMGVNYEKLIVPMLAEIQKLKARIEKLEGE